MFNIEIKISGPGLVVNYPSEIIIKALTDAGFDVTIENSHRGDPNLQLEKRDDGTKWSATVKTNHQPWGG